jgi:hypothetical protein
MVELRDIKIGDTVFLSDEADEHLAVFKGVGATITAIYSLLRERYPVEVRFDGPDSNRYLVGLNEIETWGPW